MTKQEIINAWHDTRKRVYILPAYIQYPNLKLSKTELTKSLEQLQELAELDNKQ